MVLRELIFRKITLFAFLNHHKYSAIQYLTDLRQLKIFRRV